MKVEKLLVSWSEFIKPRRPPSRGSSCTNMVFNAIITKILPNTTSVMAPIWIMPRATVERLLPIYMPVNTAIRKNTIEPNKYENAAIRGLLVSETDASNVAKIRGLTAAPMA